MLVKIILKKNKRKKMIKFYKRLCHNNANPMLGSFTLELWNTHAPSRLKCQPPFPSPLLPFFSLNGDEMRRRKGSRSQDRINGKGIYFLDFFLIFFSSFWLLVLGWWYWLPKLIVQPYTLPPSPFRWGQSQSFLFSSFPC